MGEPKRKGSEGVSGDDQRGRYLAGLPGEGMAGEVSVQV